MNEASKFLGLSGALSWAFAAIALWDAEIIDYEKWGDPLSPLAIGLWCLMFAGITLSVGSIWLRRYRPVVSLSIAAASALIGFLFVADWLRLWMQGDVNLYWIW